MVGFFGAGGATAEVGDAGGPDFLFFDWGEESDLREAVGDAGIFRERFQGAEGVYFLEQLKHIGVAIGSEVEHRGICQGDSGVDGSIAEGKAAELHVGKEESCGGGGGEAKKETWPMLIPVAVVLAGGIWADGMRGQRGLVLEGVIWCLAGGGCFFETVVFPDTPGDPREEEEGERCCKQGEEDG